jgi:hypothetical protein
MKRFLALILAVLIAGCAHSNVSLNSSGSASGGTTTVSGQVSAGGSGAAAVALFAIAVVAIHGREISNGETTYRGNPFDAITPTKPAPELSGSRRVNEQDCSKPIRDWSANLKCR